MSQAPNIGGRYSIEAPLGKGSGGTCFLVRDQLHPQTRLALKTLSNSQNTPELREAFQRECEILSRLSHPHIARLLDYRQDAEAFYYVSEYVEGSDFVTACRKLDWNAVFSLIVQGSWALDFLESSGILHRDIKPANLLVGKIHRSEAPKDQQRLRLKLIDFGLASPYPLQSDPTKIQGTFAFIAPEVLTKKSYDHRADLYSWGVSLFQMALGKLPISKSKNFSQYLDELQNQEVDLEPLKASGEIPEGILKIIEALLKRNPEQRLQRARQVIEMLNAVEGENFAMQPPQFDEALLHEERWSIPSKRKKNTSLKQDNKTFSEVVEELQAMVRAGRRAEAWNWAQSYLKLIPSQKDPKPVEKFLGILAHVLIDQGRFSEAHTWIEQMRGHPQLKNLAQVEAAILTLQLGLREGRLDESLKTFQDLPKEIWKAADLGQKTRIASYHGMILQRLGRMQEAAKVFSQAAEHAAQSQRRDHQLGLMLNEAGLHLQLGHWSRAYEVYLKAEILARELQHSVHLASCLNNLGNLYLYFGRWSEAEAALLESLRLSKQEETKPMISYNLYLLTVGEDARGNWEHVEKYLAEALHVAGESNESLPRLQALLAQAYFFWGRGDSAACEKTLVDLKTLATQSGQESFQSQALWLEAKLKISLGQYHSFPVESWLLQLEKDARTRGAHNQLWQIAADLGDLARAQNQTSQAREYYTQALRSIESLREEVPQAFRNSFYRDRKKEKIKQNLRALSPEPSPNIVVSDARLASTATPSKILSADGPDLSLSLDTPAPKRKKTMNTNQAISFRQWSEINRRLLTQHETEALLEEILDAAIELTDAERGFIILSDTMELKIRAARNFEQASLSKEDEKYSSTVAKDVLRKGVPTILLDAQKDDRFTEAASVHALNLRSVLCVPLKSGNRTVGLVYLDNRFRQGIFRQEHVPLIESLADQASLALEHARLHRENREKIAELKKSQETVERLNAQLERELQITAADLQIARESLKREHEESALRYSYEKIIGKSQVLRKVFKVLDKIVESQANVFIFGESGTGKELIAQAIHFNGSRKERAFISENCAALSENLLESELFGHVRGAFTGAERDKLGLFHLAHQGTLFLDEVGDMSLNMQAKLLRGLQEGEVRQVGGKDYRKVDVRVLCASNKDLKDLVEKGEFRQDLYYRLHVLRVDLPPLRKRREDIPLLIQYFFKKSEGTEAAPPHLTRAALKILLDYEWPGNIRELQNEVLRLKVLAEREIVPELISPQILQAAQASGKRDFQGGLEKLVSELEKNAIVDAMERFRGNKVKVAQVLKIGRRTLYAKLALYGIESRHGK